MREIKFRAWNGNTINYPESGCFASYGSICGESFTCAMSQYTGLKDINQKEIYEGDLVKFRSQMKKKNLIGEVKYICAGFYVECIKDGALHRLDGDCYSEEVIGNIYENPELIE